MNKKLAGALAFIFAAAILSLTPTNTGLAQNGPIVDPAEESSAEDAASVLESLFGPSDFEPDLEEIAKHALGEDGNPVRCDGPSGERAYLDRLRCTNGKRPKYNRVGSTGAGPYGNILDLYNVQCRGAEDASIYMDMYHSEYVEKLAVDGFTIVDAD